MKKLIIMLLIVLHPLAALCQNQSFFHVNGNLITNEDNSVLDIFNEHFSEYKLFNVYFPEDKEETYDIVYQSFSFEPIFIIADSNSKPKDCAKWIQEFNNKHRYVDRNIENNNMLKYDIQDAIENKLTDSFFLKSLGKPNSSYQSPDGYKVYSYNGIEKAFDLIFINGVVSDYRLYNDY